MSRGDVAQYSNGALYVVVRADQHPMLLLGPQGEVYQAAPGSAQLRWRAGMPADQPELDARLLASLRQTRLSHEPCGMVPDSDAQRTAAIDPRRLSQV